MRPAFENIEQNVITSKISSHVPILLAPEGIGLLERVHNLYLSTYISAILFKNARTKLRGNESPNKVKKLN